MPQEHACQADALPLAFREPSAELTDRRLDALRQALDEQQDRRFAQRLTQFIVTRLLVGDAQIARNRAVEQVRFLAHHRLQPAARVRVHARQHVAGQRHDALLRIPVPHEQLEQRRLAAARRPLQSEDARDRHVERHIAQHRRARAVRERDLIHAHAVIFRFECAEFLDRRLLVHQREQTPRRSECLRQARRQCAQRERGAE